MPYCIVAVAFYRHRMLAGTFVRPLPDGRQTNRIWHYFNGLLGDRITCQYAVCSTTVRIEEVFSCNRCNRRMCQRHKDDDDPAYCLLCAEKVRAEEFERKIRSLELPVEAEEIATALLGVTQDRPPFQARVWTSRMGMGTTRDIASIDRNSRASYRIGETFVLSVQAERDCYLTLVDAGTSGRVFILVQNYSLRGGLALTLSGPDEGHQWVVAGPPGIERIKAFFAKEPLDLSSKLAKSPCVKTWEGTRDIVTKVQRIGATLDGLPIDSWTDAVCQFVVEPVA